MLRDRAAEVNRVALDRLLQHTRRGSLQVLWDTALAEIEARLAQCEDTPAGMQSSEAKLDLPETDHFRTSQNFIHLIQKLRVMCVRVPNLLRPCEMC